MNNQRGLNSWHQCRLCGLFGHLKIDIFDEKSRPGPSNASELSSDIFRCVEVRVGRGDKTTKLCGHCFGDIHHYIGFRAVCAATDRNMRSSDGIIDEIMSTDQSISNATRSSDGIVMRNQFPLDGPSGEIISQIDDETESENVEIDEPRDIACDTQNANVEVTSFDDVSAPTKLRGLADSGVVETRKRLERELDCDASTKRGSPALTISTPSHDKKCVAQASRKRNSISIGNEKTSKFESNLHGRGVMVVHRVNEIESVKREPRHCSGQTKSTVACDALTDDETNSDFEMIAVSVQNGKKRDRNGKFSDKAKKQAMNKIGENVAGVLVECRQRGRCKESFGSWDAMMFHVANYHAKGVKKTFCCHLCKKTLETNWKLQRHVNSVHNREIRFKCPIRRCAKIFTQKCNLEQHTNAVHTKRVSFRCTKCPMKFYRKEYLTRHLSNKHGVGMTFSCYLCKKAFCGKQALQWHMNSLHTGQVRFSCPFPMCSKSFTQKGSLNMHTNAIHTKKNVFKCTECDKEFYYKQNLNKHIANVH